MNANVQPNGRGILRHGACLVLGSALLVLCLASTIAGVPLRAAINAHAHARAAAILSATTGLAYNTLPGRRRRGETCKQPDSACKKAKCVAAPDDRACALAPATYEITSFGMCCQSNLCRFVCDVTYTTSASTVASINTTTVITTATTTPTSAASVSTSVTSTATANTSLTTSRTTTPTTTTTLTTSRITTRITSPTTTTTATGTATDPTAAATATATAATATAATAATATTRVDGGAAAAEGSILDDLLGPGEDDVAEDWELAVTAIAVVCLLVGMAVCAATGDSCGLVHPNERHRDLKRALAELGIAPTTHAHRHGLAQPPADQDAATDLDDLDGYGTLVHAEGGVDVYGHSLCVRSAEHESVYSDGLPAAAGACATGGAAGAGMAEDRRSCDDSVYLEPEDEHVPPTPPAQYFLASA